MPSSNGMNTSVLGELKDCPLTIRPCRLDNDVLRVLNGNNNPSCNLKLFPCFSQVDNVNP